FERIVALSAEALLEPAFDAEEVELQRQEQVAAIARREDSLTRRSIDLFYETLYRKHPYGFPTLGTAESVPLITVSQLRGFHRRMMRPEDLVVGVAGDVRVEDVVKLLEGAFGGLRSRTAAPKTPVPEAPVVEPRQAVLRRDKAQAHLVIGFLGTTVDAADRHAMEILNAIFSGQGGRLFIELRDKRHLAYSVTSFHQEGVEPGAFAIYIGTTHANVDKAREGIWQEIRRVRDEPMDARELEDAKRYLIGSNDIDLAGLSTVAQSMALDELLGLSYKETFRQARRLQSVTAAQVQAVARRYLREEASVEALITKSAK
ncbi:insulinase family protein, partial [bacterium]|nr:insulinase family protein [bacterium]